MPEIYQSRHAGTIADLLRQRGQIGARAAQQAGDLQAQRALTSGQAWGNAIQNIGQTVSGTLADFARQKADAPRRAMEDELQRLRLAVTRGELTQQRLEQMGAEIESQATRPDGSVDRDLLTSLFQQNGIGALLPPVLREIDKREGALRQEQEGRGKQLFAATPAGPISEDALQTMNQSPEAQPHLRYSFGPGTAEGPERLETMPERRMREAEAFASEQGGVVSPTGAITLPPRETPVNLRPEDVLVDGRPRKAVFNPQTGRYSIAGQDVTDRVQPIPPASATQTPTQRFVIRKGEVIPITEGQARPGDIPYSAEAMQGVGGENADARSMRTAAALNSIDTLKELAQVRMEGPLGMLQGAAESAKGALGYNTNVRQYNALLQPTAMQMAVAIQGAAGLSNAEREVFKNMLGSIGTMDYQSQLALLERASELIRGNADVDYIDVKDPKTSQIKKRWVPRRSRMPGSVQVNPANPGAMPAPADPLGIRPGGG